MRSLGKGDVIGGFAGATADAFTLFERLESKLEQYPAQLTRACVELAKDWRTDRYLRRLEAMMIVADRQVTLVLTGTGDVLEPEGGVMGIGSGGNYALAAAKALMEPTSAPRRSPARPWPLPPQICVYTNTNWWSRRWRAVAERDMIVETGRRSDQRMQRLPSAVHGRRLRCMQTRRAQCRATRRRGAPMLKDTDLDAAVAKGS